MRDTNLLTHLFEPSSSGRAPVLLLNGGMMSFAAWEPIATALRPGFPLLRCDLPTAPAVVRSERRVCRRTGPRNAVPGPIQGDERETGGAGAFSPVWRQVPEGAVPASDRWPR